jgi:TonB family protein
VLNKASICFCLAVCIHILGFFCLAALFIKKNSDIGQEVVIDYVPAFLATAAHHNKENAAQVAKKLTGIAKQAEFKLSKKKIESFKKNVIRPNSLQQNPLAQGTDENALLQLLHENIAAKQYYPAQSKELFEEGKVTVTFALLPNGEITALKISQSSKIKRLDDAALKTVKIAAPFKKAAHYISAPKIFNIEMQYEL